MIKKRDYLSASQVSTFLSCPLLYKKTYVNWEKQSFKGSMEYVIYWTAIHAVLEYNYKQKMESRVDLPLEEILDFWNKTFSRLLNEDSTKFNEKNVTDLTKVWIKMLTLYMRDIAPNNQPIAVEQFFEIVSEKYWLVIKWQIDLITEDWLVIDFKTIWDTKAKMWSQKYVDNLLQLTMYSIAYRKTYWKSETWLKIEALKRLKTWPKLDIIETKRTTRQIEQLWQLMKQMRKLIDLWLFYPNLNSCNWCDFETSCSKLCLDDEVVEKEIDIITIDLDISLD